MCGIIAISSSSSSPNHTVIQSLIDGMYQLQNRGYDSMGVATWVDGAVQVTKCVNSDVQPALAHIKASSLLHTGALCGIGHTRWATHGSKTDANAHPHVSFNNKFYIVHNGIIENYAELKQSFLSVGIPFVSETDTEVIANCLAVEWEERNHENIYTCISNVTKQLHGTWGLVIMCTDFPNTLFATRKGSSLLISQSIHGNLAMVSSEQAGFANKCTSYFSLEENDICTIEQGKVSTTRGYQLKETTEFCASTSPDPYPHWMLKEIYEQPESILRVMGMGGRIDGKSIRLGGLVENEKRLRDVNNILLLGCGTSFNAAVIGQHFLKSTKLFNVVLAIDGADFTEVDFPQTGHTAIMLLSQSGETKDLHRCLQIARDHCDTITIGIVNVVDSIIAREVDCGCYLNAGREVAVASTKSFTSQFALMAMMACWWSQSAPWKSTLRIKEVIDDLRKLPMQINELMNSSLSSSLIASIITNLFQKKEDVGGEGIRNHCFVLGRGIHEVVAKEAALKIKEVSYIHAEGWSSAGLKHGPFALLNDSFPVIMLIPSSDEFQSKNINALQEVRARDAPVLVITDSSASALREQINNCAQIVLETPHNHNFSGILFSIVLQLIAYHLALSRGINPDIPRNLAKVVTVE